MNVLNESHFGNGISQPHSEEQFQENSKHFLSTHILFDTAAHRSCNDPRHARAVGAS